MEDAPLRDILTIANELLTSLRTITNYDEFRTCMREDEEAQRIIEQARIGSTPYEVQDDIIKYRLQLDTLTYIPKKLREIIMLQYHDGTLGGHLSSKKPSVASVKNGVRIAAYVEHGETPEKV